jgi:hypothetical protein
MEKETRQGNPEAMKRRDQRHAIQRRLGLRAPASLREIVALQRERKAREDERDALTKEKEKEDKRNKEKEKEKEEKKRRKKEKKKATTKNKQKLHAEDTSRSSRKAGKTDKAKSRRNANGDKNDGGKKRKRDELDSP